MGGVYTDAVIESVPARATAGPPRWHAHGYNRAAVYRFGEALAWLPRRGRLALARRVGRLATRFLPAERAVVRKTLAIITGATGDRLEDLTARVFSDFAMCFSDLVSANRRAPHQRLAYVNPVPEPDDGAGSSGLVSVTAHVGNWELAGRLLATGASRRTHVVVAPDEAPELARWVRRNGDGVRFVPRDHPAVGVALLAALRRGEVVALQGDRALGSRADVSLPFFGRPARFPLGPFVLARAAGVSVLPAFCVLDRGYRYTLRVGTPIAVERGAEEQAAQAWVALLEDVVRDHPTQWFNFFDVWNPVTE